LFKKKIQIDFFFKLETNQPNTPLNREIIAAELHIKEDKTTKQVYDHFFLIKYLSQSAHYLFFFNFRPLIYSILWHFLNNDTNSANAEQPSISRTSNDPKAKKISIYKYNHEQLD
jgi:hypothetical protein